MCKSPIFVENTSKNGMDNYVVFERLTCVRVVVKINFQK